MAADPTRLQLRRSLQKKPDACQLGCHTPTRTDSTRARLRLRARRHPRFARAQGRPACSYPQPPRLDPCSASPPRASTPSLRSGPRSGRLGNASLSRRGHLGVSSGARGRPGGPCRRTARSPGCTPGSDRRPEPTRRRRGGAER
ncbi:hypothetical protein DB30_07898 [Enhygromyxa salina]|uniref:Uncharacterized protein n=1 Tax=Enhygromyxa salina TaxID=215803 RepID=A0A0C2CVP2_9BACT|nr:hypothetical protein DB30_07898 [Enhygromyxa salina]